MPIPMRVARWNRAGLNRLTQLIAPWMPGMGVVVHRGRTSGREYFTPVNLFWAGDAFVIALTYGTATDWLKNVLAAGGCEIHARGRWFRVGAPRIYHDETRPGIRPLERWVLGLLAVSDFLSLTIEPPSLEDLSTCEESSR
jgi:deazaflavin-dependent oxidoreductase (nitroreductase family)